MLCNTETLYQDLARMVLFCGAWALVSSVREWCPDVNPGTRPCFGACFVAGPPLSPRGLNIVHDHESGRALGHAGWLWAPVQWAHAHCS